MHTGTHKCPRPVSEHRKTKDPSKHKKPKRAIASVHRAKARATVYHPLSSISAALPRTPHERTKILERFSPARIARRTPDASARPMRVEIRGLSESA